MADNKHLGSSFNDDLFKELKNDDQAVFLHLKNALENPSLGEGDDYRYLLNAIKDVAAARGKSDLADKAGITRQGLHKILNGETTPSIQNVMAILAAIGLRFSIGQVRRVISDDKRAKVLDVARYAVGLLGRGDTYMKLQKIVYYAQVESLIKFKRPLFDEKIEAWAAGPVIRELYKKHKGLKYINDQTLGDPSHLSMEQRACINWAIEKYGKLDGDTLSHITHIEDPWKNARKGLSLNSRSAREITHKSLLSYYTSLPNYSELDERSDS